MDAEVAEGLAFDTNLLSKPTQRRLMSLWMEVSDGKVLLLPQVVAELRAPNKRDLGDEARRINAAHRAAWDRAMNVANGPFATVTLTADEQATAYEILNQFTLRCFPKLNRVDEIPQHSDAVILAQGLACGVECVVTNNMASLDHREVNGLVSEVMGRNASFVLTADDAMLDAHAHGESSRRLLGMAMASCWPDGGREMTVDEAHDRLGRLCNILTVDVNMPGVAQRLMNAFEVDPELQQVIDSARALSQESSALACERERTETLRKRPDRSLGAAPRAGLNGDMG